MLDFKPSDPLTLGVELELQLVNTRDWNLTRGASDLLAAVAKKKHPGEIKPEITESMVEISTSICRGYDDLLADLRALRDVVARAAASLNLGVGGGGTHPFQKWSERRIYDTPRFKHVSDLYGYLAKQFTVFGQHVHVGVRSGDEAVRLTQGLARYMPHFIALSASSPFSLGADTQFDSSRLNVVNAFPLAGIMPPADDWEDFERYFEAMRGYGIVESMKDFYWDIRPRAEYGTVEIRVFDTPLSVERAAALAAYAQALARHLLTDRPRPPSREVYLLYNYNRFQACRYGLGGKLIDADTGRQVPLKDDVLETIARIEPHAAALGGGLALKELEVAARSGAGDAEWLRRAHKERGTLTEVARLQSDFWMGLARPAR